MKDMKQSEYITEIAKEVMNNNKKIKADAKLQKEKILASLGYCKDVYYTRKEKKAFTRKVKKLMFGTKPETLNLTPEEWKERFQQEKQDKLQKLENRTHISVIIAEYENYKAQLKALLKKKDKPVINDNKKKFKYVVQRLTEDNPPRNIDFITNYIKANDIDDAKKLILEKAKEYKQNDSKFGGINITELNADGKEGTMYGIPSSAIAA